MDWHPKPIRRCLPSVRFLTVHYFYFISLCLLSSVILWASSTPSHSVRFIDALFLAVSAMTLAGLNTVNLSTLNTFQQMILFFLIMLGSAIWVSIAVLLVRRRAFAKRFSDVIEEERLTRKGALTSITLGRGISLPRSSARSDGPTSSQQRKASPKWRPSSCRADSNASPQTRTDRHSFESEYGLSGFIGAMAERESVGPRTKDETTVAGRDETPRNSFQTGVQANSSNPGNHENHVAFAPNASPLSRARSASIQLQRLRPPYTNVRARIAAEVDEADKNSDPSGAADGHLQFLRKIGRNSTFHHLTETERHKLGGVEYRAVSLLTLIVPIYFFLWQILGGLGIGAYIARNRASTTETNGLNPWWAGFFFAISAFNNSGMSLVDANMVAFQTSTYMLNTMGLLILAGNTCYPIFLRLILYTMRRVLPDTDDYRADRETLQFLLNHPRRCYTNLFPSRHTWWLLCSVIVLNGIDWVAFELLNLDNPVVTGVPPGTRALIGLFQALCVRSGGFYVVNISALQLGMQVIYVVMMYISVYPVVITIRHSNVYEERSLGIYADDPLPSSTDGSDTTGQHDSGAGNGGSKLPWMSTSGRLYFVQQQLRAQLAYDSWWIALAVIIICIVEAGSFNRDPVTYSAFNIIFETVSAYGTVGISTGLPNQLYSFSGGWHTLSKLVLCAVMLRGRHRGLPVAIDKAILLPGEHLARAEEEDANIRLERTMSRTRGIV